MHVIVTGVPKAGKTTLCNTELQITFGVTALHTDDLIQGRDWSALSQFVVDDWMARPGPWLIEGIAAVRALRKFMKLYPIITPCDTVYWMPEPKVEYTLPGQVTLARSCLKIWEEVRPMLKEREVEIIQPS